MTGVGAITTVLSTSVSASDAPSAILLGGGLAEGLAGGLSGRTTASRIVGEELRVAATLGAGLALGLGLFRADRGLSLGTVAGAGAGEGV